MVNHIDPDAQQPATGTSLTSPTGCVLIERRVGGADPATLMMHPYYTPQAYLMSSIILKGSPCGSMVTRLPPIRYITSVDVCLYYTFFSPTSQLAPGTGLEPVIS